MFRCINDRWGWTVVVGLGALPLIGVVALGGFLLINSAAALAELSWRQCMAGTWSPARGQFGLLPLILGTLATTALALVVAVPVGLSTAVYLTLFAGPKVRAAADAAVAVLGGLPSVVVGLWGMTWIVPLCGNSLASGSLVLALMIAPTFTLVAEAALRQVPADVVETTRALGVGDGPTALVVLRHARWGIVTAATLALSRALGEAVAISLVAGNVPAWPTLTGPVATLTTTLIIEFDGAAGLHRNALYLLALLVMMLIAAGSIAGRSAERKRFAS
jgi:phosphate transport system permease protein